MTTATAIRNDLSERLTAFATISTDNATAFTVRGWPFAIIRNGHDAWDILHPHGLFEACPAEHLAASIAGFVVDAEAENAGWDFDAESIDPLKTDPCEQ